MNKYCPQCGHKIQIDSSFCSQCGHAVSGNDTQRRETASANSVPPPAKSGKPKRAPVQLSTIIVIALIVIYGIRFFGPKVNTSWVVDAACAEVQSEVYSIYGDVPKTSGEVIYKDSPDYIVVVKYRIPGWNWEASRACHMYGYRENNCAIFGMTNEQSYDYNYKAHLAELKALWALN